MRVEEQNFANLIKEAWNTPFTGWDFSFLYQRKTDAVVSWSYSSEVKKRLTGVSNLLDMGTGGGELLSTLVPLPKQTYATEGYSPNLKIAEERLEPIGVKLVSMVHDQENRTLPFAPGYFDMVINRHECFTAQEIYRILKPTGVFLTQQCGGYGEVNLIEFFIGKIEPMDWTVDIAATQLEKAGFLISIKEEEFPEYRFYDIGAVVYYLKAIPWMVKDFCPEKYKAKLFAMHEYIQSKGYFSVKDQRFLIEATK
jgi:SAM-dependent methyltransferase